MQTRDQHELAKALQHMYSGLERTHGIWTAKKRYILNVHNSEGVQYAEPKLKVMGVEAVKSSTPQVCRDRFKEIFNVILLQGEQATQHFLKEFKKEFYGPK